MNRGKARFYKISLLAAAGIMLAAVLTSCPSNEKFGADSDYFVGLQKLAEALALGNTTRRRTLLLCKTL